MICSLTAEQRSITIDAESLIDVVTASFREKVWPYIRGRTSGTFNPENYISRKQLLELIAERFLFFQEVLDLSSPQTGLNAFQLHHALDTSISKLGLNAAINEKENPISIPVELHAYNGYLQGALSYCLLKLCVDVQSTEGFTREELISALSGANRPALQQVEFWNNLDVFDSSLSKPALTDFSFLDRIIINTGTPALLIHFPERFLEDYLKVVFHPFDLNEHQKNDLRTWFQSSFATQYIRPMEIDNLNLAFLIISTLHLSGIGKKEHWFFPDKRLVSLPDGFQKQKNHWLANAFLMNGNSLKVKSMENLSKQFYKHNDQHLIDVKEVRNRLESFISDTKV